jgi:glycosyltransferase involved in cell wall biosynthesis
MRNVMGSEERAPAALGGTGPAVLHVIPTAIGRGAQVFARALVDELGGAQGGHRLASLFQGQGDIAVDLELGLPGGPAAAEGLHRGALAHLRRHLRDVDYEVVVAHGGDAFKYLALATGAPIAYCVIGTWPAASRRSVQTWAWRALIRRAWAAVAVSDDVAEDCRTVLAAPRRRVVVIPNGRDEDRYLPPSAGRDDATVTLLFVGRLFSGKRPDRFVQLVKGLRDEGLAVRGRIVGDGPMREELEGPAAAAGVDMVGWCADVVPHLQEADLLVFPSDRDGEGMPGVLIEAGLCGLPVVATRVAGAATVVADGETGVLVPVGDRRRLAAATAELVVDPARRLAMGAKARERCLARFTLGVVAGEWDELLRRAAVGDAP